MSDASNARVGITGAVRVAPFGTVAVPTDATTVLDAAFDDLGFLSDDGVTVGFEDSVQNVFAWQSAQLIRSITSESVTSLNFMMLETKADNLEFFFRGSSITEVAVDNFRLDIAPLQADPRVVVLDIIDGPTSIRFLFENAEVIQRGEVQFANQDLAMWPITMNFYPASNGLLGQAFSNSVAWDPSP